MKARTLFCITAIVLFAFASACKNGKTQIAEGIFAPMGEPMPRATEEQLETFQRGQEVGLKRFSGPEGLGPHFNVTFCNSCHEQPVQGGSSPRYRDFLLIGRRNSDGSFQTTGVNGIQPQYTLGPQERHPDAEGTNVVTKRNAIPFFGVGLLARVPEDEILSHADPNDEDGDGISGKPNIDRGFVGRFGRKAQTVSLESFIRGPLFNHLGITTDPLTSEQRAELPVPSALEEGDAESTSSSLRAVKHGHGIGSTRAAQAGAPDEPTTDEDGVPDPEMSGEQLFDLISFTMLLAAPEPEPLTGDAEEGRALFEEANCTGCHIPKLKTPRGAIPAYTDLLLHDMGEELADGIAQKFATGSEFRTQPLWGVTAVAPYLHDGRADTLDEAIRMHGGEAQASRDAYVNMSSEEQQKIIAFLDSLGGASQDSDGLLPPDPEVPDVGEYGGPVRPLSESEMAKFKRGRQVFDRDQTINEGLGPNFNGDSCRACHFEPAVGGAGPAGTDVTRQGILDKDTGEFTFPEGGTMAHKHSIHAKRPDIDEDANVFETRQTPPIFGLGLIDRIPKETIVANEDPDDEDGDGISGRAHILPDGQVGRTGWKANFPSSHEFTRDALANEMGVSMPDEPGKTAGFAEDDDEVPDPEISRDDLEALVFFVENLAPPPRTHHNRDMEQAGKQVFNEIGCADCHHPSMETEGGMEVPLYSDLLLHDVAPPDDKGIAAGDASHREFRTAPLWGIAKTAPYMHDGRAFTIEEAIAQHYSEASGVRENYMMLSAQERQQLLAFLKSL